MISRAKILAYRWAQLRAERDGIRASFAERLEDSVNLAAHCPDALVDDPFYDRRELRDDELPREGLG